MSDRLAILLVLLLAGCVQSVRIDLTAGIDEPVARSADIEIAKEVVEAVAREFGFARHPDEDWYKQRSRTRAWAKLEFVSAYFYSGSKEYGRIDLFLAYSREDRHAVVLISDMDAYGRSSLVESLQDAVVAALAEAFPGKRIEVDSSRGLSPLGP